MYRQLVLAVALAPLMVFSATSSPRVLLGDTVGLVARQNSAACGVSREVCEDSCMPIGAVCCNDNSSTYCRAGNRCIPNGCCRIGEICAGGGGTITNYDIFPTTSFGSATATRTGSAGATTAIGSGDDDDNEDSSSSDDDSTTSSSRTRTRSATPTSTTTNEEDTLTVSSEDPAQSTESAASSPTGLTGAGAGANANSNSNPAATSASVPSNAFSPRALDDKSLFGGMILAIAAFLL